MFKAHLLFLPVAWLLPGLITPLFFIGSDALAQTNRFPYQLAAGDTLGIFVEGVIGEFDSNPPVQYPDANSDLPPAIGFPTVVRPDGTLTLPLIKPVPVRGLTVRQAEATVRRAYSVGSEPFILESSRVIVTLQRKRTISVTVIRQDARPDANFGGRQQTFYQQGVTDRSDQSARGNVLQMPVGQNDLLTALLQTGGIPGVNALPQIRISRQGVSTEAYRLDRSISDLRFEQKSRKSASPFPRSNSRSNSRSNQNGFGADSRPGQRSHATFYRGPAPATTKVTRSEIRVPVPIRGGTNQTTRLEKVRLADGDILYVDARPTEVYYTGGQLAGGEYPLPRDRRLDVFEAVAIAGGAVGNNGGIAAGSVPPGELLVVRKLPGGRQTNIRIDLKRAIQSPAQRMAVQPGDTLILQYSPQERLHSIGVQTFNAYGLRSVLGR